MIQVVIVSESPVYRSGLTTLLRGVDDSDLQIIDPSILLEEEFNGVVIVLKDEYTLFSSRINTKNVVVILNRQDKPDWVPDNGHPGWGVLPYNASGDDLDAAIHAVYQGLAVFPASEVRSFIKERTSRLSEQDRVIENLTDRELEIFRQLGQGLQNKQIAHALGISENTVKFHISSIFSKLGVSNRTEALHIGSQLGLLSL